MASLSPEQRKLFTDKNFVSVATIGKDGTPRNTVVWVDAEGDHIVINGAKSRGWLKNLKRNPNVALTIFDSAQPYRRVSVVGKAVEITEQGGEEHIDKLSQKYGGRLYPAHEEGNPRTIVRIQPENVTSMGVG
jgi:PPOX class probable F420-dependent enzyme